MYKKIGFLVLIVIFGLVAINLIRQTTDALQAGKRLDQAADELAKLQEKNRQLKNRLAEIQTIQFIEEQARNKLNLARPDETVVIIAQDQIAQVLKQNEPTTTPTLNNWQGWMRLFFDWL